MTGDFILVLLSSYNKFLLIFISAPFFFLSRFSVVLTCRYCTIFRLSSTFGISSTSIFRRDLSSDRAYFLYSPKLRKSTALAIRRVRWIWIRYVLRQLVAGQTISFVIVSMSPTEPRYDVSIRFSSFGFCRFSPSYFNRGYRHGFGV